MYRQGSRSADTLGKVCTRCGNLRRVGQPLFQLIFQVLDIVDHLVVRPLSCGKRFDKREQFLDEHRVDIRIRRKVEQVLKWLDKV